MKNNPRRCKTSYSNKKLRILLDSTYLLPILGVDVEEIEKTLVVLKNLKVKQEAKYYYSPYSLLEILGKISRTKYDRDRLRLGLVALQENFESALPTIDGYIKALEYRARGFKDLIDLLLYFTAQSNNILFLTRDEELVEFLSIQNEDLSIILLENELLEKYK